MHVMGLFLGNLSCRIPYATFGANHSSLAQFGAELRRFGFFFALLFSSDDGVDRALVCTLVLGIHLKLRMGAIECAFQFCLDSHTEGARGVTRFLLFSILKINGSNDFCKKLHNPYFNWGPCFVSF